MLLPTHSKDQSGNVWHEPDGPYKDAELVELRLWLRTLARMDGGRPYRMDEHEKDCQRARDPMKAELEDAPCQLPCRNGDDLEAASFKPQWGIANPSEAIFNHLLFLVGHGFPCGDCHHAFHEMTHVHLRYSRVGFSHLLCHITCSRILCLFFSCFPDQ